MHKTLLFLLVAVTLTSCGSFHYDIVKPSDVRGIHPDSLRWKYVNGMVVGIPVRDKNDEIRWLDVNENTTLFLKMVEGEEYYMQLQSVVVEEPSDGLLGSNTMWRGYDLRSRAQRSVFIREIDYARISSKTPAKRTLVRN